MIKEPGLFSNRYLTRKGKQNHNHNNVGHNKHADEIDFPLAYTSTKGISKQRASISVKKAKIEDKKNQTKLKEQEERLITQINKLQKQLRESKEQLKKVNKQLQNKTIQYQNFINDLSKQLKQKDDLIHKQSIQIKEQTKLVNQSTTIIERYTQTIKNQIYWLLNIFMKLQQTDFSLNDLRNEVSNYFLSFKEYIQQFNIEKELQQRAAISSRKHSLSINLQKSSILKAQQDHFQKINSDSMFTQDIEGINMIKIMELHPLIETFNNQHQFISDNYKNENSNDKMERITKKLFDDSPLFKDSNNNSISINNTSQQLESKNKSLKQDLSEIDLPREVVVNENFIPGQGQQNFIQLIQGQIMKLLRKVRNNLWIGQFKQKIGLVLQTSFRLQ